MSNDQKFYMHLLLAAQYNQVLLATFRFICDLACLYLCEVTTKKPIGARYDAAMHFGLQTSENLLRSCFFMICKKFLEAAIGEGMVEQPENGL